MSDSAQRASLKRKIKKKFNLDDDTALLGDGAGRIYDNSRPGYVYVRQPTSIDESGNPIYSAFTVRHNPNAIYRVADGTRVNLFIDRDGELAIEGADFGGMVAGGGNPAALNPSNPYTKFINPDQLLPLRASAIANVTQPTLKVMVDALAYVTSGNVFQFFAGAQYDFTADVPSTSGKKALALLYLDDTNAIDCVVGSDKDAILNFDVADITATVALMPTTGIPIAIWALRNGMTTITEKDKYLDLRQWLNMPSSATQTGHEALIWLKWGKH
jgi:hypothetical protein